MPHELSAFLGLLGGIVIGAAYHHIYTHALNPYGAWLGRECWVRPCGKVRFAKHVIVAVSWRGRGVRARPGSHEGQLLDQKAKRALARAVGKTEGGRTMKHGNPYEFEDGGAEKRGLVWMALTILLALALAVALCWIDRQNAAMAQVVEESKPETYDEEYLPGQPLDAVKVTAPTFADGEYAYKVADRTSGACWWLVKDPDGTWQVLPVCEGKSYVAQQEVEVGK